MGNCSTTEISAAVFAAQAQVELFLRGDAGVLAVTPDGVHTLQASP
jgi:hypothetical protein